MDSRKSPPDLSEEQVERAVRAYAEYSEAATAAPQPWLPLSALVAQHQAKHRKRLAWWWPAAAAAICAAAVVLLYWLPARASRQTNQLLAQAVKAGEPEGRLISMQFQGRSIVRPAVLRTGSHLENDVNVARLQRMFADGGYSWREPLSAGSFQNWRSRLRSKRDIVTVLRREGEKAAYRVQTDNPAGVLQSVSLVLRAEDLRPTNGRFSFRELGDVQSAEVATETAAAPPGPEVPERAVETLATPQDTLNVLAALNRIGADVGEPISIAHDAQQRNVVVYAAGLSAERQTEVVQALRDLPRVTLQFGPMPAAPPAETQAKREPSSSNIPGAVRKQFEERAGGAVRLQVITDDVLDASSLLLARAHALQVLADQFPPAAETQLKASGQLLLEQLQRRHLAAALGLVKKLRELTQGLLPLPGAARISGPPPDARALVALAAETDGLLNRLLAGSFSEAEGEEMFLKAGTQLERLESAIHRLQRARVTQQ